MLRDFNLDVCHSNVALNDRYLVQACIDEAMCTRIGVYDYRLALGCPDYPLNHDGNWHFLRMRSPGVCPFLVHSIIHSDNFLKQMIEFIYDDILAIRCVESEYISQSNLQLLPSYYAGSAAACRHCVVGLHELPSLP